MSHQCFWRRVLRPGPPLPLRRVRFQYPFFPAWVQDTGVAMTGDRWLVVFSDPEPMPEDAGWRNWMQKADESE